MSDIFENAIKSIQLGIEDYQSNDDRRPVSAIRNFYAGVLLLGKECLFSAAPDADPMEILASKFVPVPDEEGGVIHEPKGFRTIDLAELRDRFKAFGLNWPSGNIQHLQKLRNDFEHFHSPAPKEAIQQAIADCFPLVQGFFEILQRDPARSLGEAWEVMLAEEAFFAKQKAQCDTSFDNLSWGGSFNRSDQFNCSACGSSLIYQVDRENSYPSSIEGRCLACGEEFTAEQTVKMLVEAEYGIDDYISYKDGGEPTIYDCPECGEPTYVFDGDTNTCYFCEEAISGECGLCSTALTVANQSVNNTSLCDYCDYRMDKVKRE